MAKMQDPVCGMTIDGETAPARVEAEGRAYYFCSTACREAFAADPDRYVARGAQPAAEGREQVERHEPPYTVTGFLTSPKFGAAGSGGLEYERLPEAHGPGRR